MTWFLKKSKSVNTRDRRRASPERRNRGLSPSVEAVEERMLLTLSGLNLNLPTHADIQHTSNSLTHWDISHDPPSAEGRIPVEVGYLLDHGFDVGNPTSPIVDDGFGGKVQHFLYADI